jgi:hypothetical protein
MLTVVGKKRRNKTRKRDAIYRSSWALGAGHHGCSDRRVGTGDAKVFVSTIDHANIDQWPKNGDRGTDTHDGVRAHQNGNCGTDAHDGGRAHDNGNRGTDTYGTEWPHEHTNAHQYSHKDRYNHEHPHTNSNDYTNTNCY